MTHGELICTRCGQTGHVAASCKQHMPGKRGVNYIQDLKDRSDVDPATHCWNWKGAFEANTPRIYTFDYRAGEKVALSGPLAVWMIAHEEPPRAGWLVFRGCTSPRCVNPAHHAQARSQAEIGAHIATQGRRKGKNAEVRRESAAKGRASQGIVQTPDSIVVAIASDLLTNGYPRGSCAALAKKYSVPKSLVSKIAVGKRHVAGIGKLSMKQFSFHGGGNTGKNPASIAALRRGLDASKQLVATP